MLNATKGTNAHRAPASLLNASSARDMALEGLAQGRPFVANEVMVQFREGTSEGDKAIKAVDYFTNLRLKGVNVVATPQGLFVAAAGNDGRNNDLTVSYPSGYALDNIITVAVLTNTGALASCASMSGTSMATPHVTGAVALHKARFLHRH